MESPGCMLAGTSHRHRYTHSSTVQIQLKTWIKLTHPHPSACQTLALQWLCYQAPHSKRHVKRQIQSIFFCLHKESSYCFPQPIMLHLKLKSTRPAVSKGIFFLENRQFIKSELPAVTWESVHHITSVLRLKAGRVMRVLALSCTAGSMSGTSGSKVALLCQKCRWFQHHKREVELEKMAGGEGKRKSLYLPL